MLLSLALLGALVAPPSAAPEDTIPAARLLRSSIAQVSVFTPYAAPLGASTSVSARTSIDAPRVIEYSDAYFTRLTIHKWASYLTLPLFAGQYAVGRKLLNGDGSDRMRSVHGLLAGSIAGLFAVNTVTGGLNAIEAWKDPEGRTRRTLHTVLMMAADVGFLVTAATAQEDENEGGVRRIANNTTHRNVALASMGTAVVGIAVMLPIFGR